MAGTTLDRLGFLLEDADVATLNKVAAGTYATTILPRQRKAWAEVAAVAKVAPLSDVASAVASLRKSGKLKNMVRGGIPPELRAKVWPLLCGAEQKRMALNEHDYYARLLRTVEATEAADTAARAAAEGMRVAGDPPRASWETLDTLEQIDKDLKRTFPKHRLIGTAEGQASMRRVLRAYCAGRNPRTGYCQGMNFLAGMLLCAMSDDGAGGVGAGSAATNQFTKPSSQEGLFVASILTPAVEENAFWMMVVLIERLLPSDYYTDGLTGVRVDSQILLDLVTARLPSLAAHLEATQVDVMLPMVTTQVRDLARISALRDLPSPRSIHTSRCCWCGVNVNVVSTQWFIALFVLWLPTETLLRLWDCFLADSLKSKHTSPSRTIGATWPHPPPTVPCYPR